MFKNKKNKKNNNLDNILDECLERILVNGESVEDCLADYPEYYEELKSLLAVSTNTKKAMTSIKARPEFKAKLGYEINSAFNESSAPKRSLFKWHSQWAHMAVSFCIILLISGGGLVAASGDSMPDNPLYSVKLATEKAQLFFTFSNEGKSELYAEFVNERVNEIITMASENNAEALGKSSKIMENQLAMISNISSTGSNFTEGIHSDGGTKAVITSTIVSGNSDTHVAHTVINTTATSTTTNTNPTGEEILCITSTFSTTNMDSPLVQMLINSYNSNLEALYIAMEGTSGDVLQALMEAIAILENGYNTAVDNIS